MINEKRLVKGFIGCMLLVLVIVITVIVGRPFMSAKGNDATQVNMEEKSETVPMTELTPEAMDVGLINDPNVEPVIDQEPVTDQEIIIEPEPIIDPEPVIDSEITPIPEALDIFLTVFNEAQYLLAPNVCKVQSLYIGGNDRNLVTDIDIRTVTTKESILTRTYFQDEVSRDRTFVTVELKENIDEQLAYEVVCLGGSEEVVFPIEIRLGYINTLFAAVDAQGKISWIPVNIGGDIEAIYQLNINVVVGQGDLVDVVAQGRIEENPILGTIIKFDQPFEIIDGQIYRIKNMMNEHIVTDKTPLVFVPRIAISGDETFVLDVHDMWQFSFYGNGWTGSSWQDISSFELINRNEYNIRGDSLIDLKSIREQMSVSIEEHSGFQKVTLWIPKDVVELSDRGYYGFEITEASGLRTSLLGGYQFDNREFQDDIGLFAMNILKKVEDINDILIGIARNLEVMDVIFKEEGDYENAFYMVEERNNIIGKEINEILIKNHRIKRVQILKQDSMVYDSQSSDNEQSSLLYASFLDNKLKDFKLRSYVKDDQSGDSIYFMKLKNIMNNDNAFIIFEIRNSYLVEDLDQIMQNLPTGIDFDIRDMNGTSIFAKDESEYGVEVIREINDFGWETILYKTNVE